MYIDTDILVTYYPKHALAPCNFVAMPVVHNYAVRKNVVRLKILMYLFYANVYIGIFQGDSEKSKPKTVSRFLNSLLSPKVSLF